MKDGKVIQTGTPQTVYATPIDEYTGGLFGKYNIIRADRFRAFSSLSGMKKIIADAGGKMIFLRPEQFKVGRKSQRALRAKVTEVFYYGDHSQAEVSVAKTTILVNTGSQQLQPGDTIYINKVQGEPWYI